MREASETNRFEESVDTAIRLVPAIIQNEASSPRSHNLRPLLPRAVRLLRDRRNAISIEPMRSLLVVPQSLVRSNVEMHLEFIQIRTDERATRLSRRQRLSLAEDDRAERVEALGSQDHGSS